LPGAVSGRGQRSLAASKEDQPRDQIPPGKGAKAVFAATFPVQSVRFSDGTWTFSSPPGVEKAACAVFNRNFRSKRNATSSLGDRRLDDPSDHPDIDRRSTDPGAGASPAKAGHMAPLTIALPEPDNLQHLFHPNRRQGSMHTLAIISGTWIHLVGDIGLCVAGTVTAFGLNGYVYDEYYEFSSRGAAAFKLLPVPVGLSLAGLILIRWGIAGM
jgi:hypothetical protein